MAESTSLLSPTQDPNSPYHLHPDYKPENKLSTVTLTLAGEDNYFIWKRDALEFLRMRNKTGFVDGTISRPDPSSPLFEAWEQCNDMVTCWLMNSVSNALQYYVAFARTAHKAWVHFRLIFAPSPGLKIHQLRERIALMRQDGDSVGRYFRKLSLAYEELSEYDPVPECVCVGCKCEITKRAKEAREKEKIFAFLFGSDNDVTITSSLVYAMSVDWKIYQLRYWIAILRQKSSSLDVYFRNVNLAWLELSECDPLLECACGGCFCDIAKRAKEAREKEKLCGFLMGLNREMNSLKIRIRLMKSPPSLTQAYSLLLSWT